MRCARSVRMLTHDSHDSPIDFMCSFKMLKHLFCLWFLRVSSNIKLLYNLLFFNKSSEYWYISFPSNICGLIYLDRKYIRFLNFNRNTIFNIT